MIDGVAGGWVFACILHYTLKISAHNSPRGTFDKNFSEIILIIFQIQGNFLSF